MSSGLLSLLLRDEVHLVHQTEDLGVLRILLHGLQARGVVLHVLAQLTRLDVKDVNQHLHQQVEARCQGESCEGEGEGESSEGEG